MKKAVSLILVFLLLLSVTSCSENKKPDDTADTTEEEKNFQSYEDLEYKSDDRYTDSQLLTFPHKDGTFVAEANRLLVITENSTALDLPFDSSGQYKYTDLELPFGAKMNDSFSTFAEKYSLDTGYAAYVKPGSDIRMFDSEKSVSFKDSEGGYLYFGYARDGMGNWAYMDYYMLVYLMRGLLDVRGAEGDYNVIVYCCTVDETDKITQITHLYGEIGKVMSLTAR